VPFIEDANSENDSENNGSDSENGAGGVATTVSTTNPVATIEGSDGDRVATPTSVVQESPIMIATFDVETEAEPENEQGDMDAMMAGTSMWKQFTDPTTGRSYYAHRETRETSWVRPPDHELRVLNVTTI
jgi:hypothetical protein